MEMKGAVGISPAQVSGHTGGCEGAEERLGSGPHPSPRCCQLCPTAAHEEVFTALVCSGRCLVPWQGL